MRAIVRRLRRNLGEDASTLTYFFGEPRVGYRMAKGEKPGVEGACAVRWAEYKGEANADNATLHSGMLGIRTHP